MSRHHLFDPEGMAPARGFSHGALVASGRTLYIAGQAGHHGDESIDEGLVDQFAQACRSVARVIEEAGGTPQDLVSMTIYTTDVAGYRAGLREIGVAYRAVFDTHYPPMALLGVTSLFDERAKVELICVAVVPD